MSKLLFLLVALVSAGLDTVAAQQRPAPADLVTNRSATQEATSPAGADLVRRNWATGAISRFLDEGAAESKPEN